MKADSVWNFFFPELTKKFFIRFGIVLVTAFIFFKFICLPLFINGRSMEPTYGARGLNFCWRPVFWFSSPKRQQIVIVRYAGYDEMLLKRLVAFEGEAVEFRNGVLYIDGKALDEPYVKYPCDWNMPVRIVEKNKVYVVGDNRSMLIDEHKFGQVDKSRIAGVPLW